MEKWNKQNNKALMIIPWIWLFFSCIRIIQSFAQGQTITNSQENFQNILQANKILQNQDYEKALALINGTHSEDYYNRATIQTLLAYKKATQSSISWLQEAQTLITQAQQNFDIAQKLTNNSKIQQAITTNKTNISSLTTVIDIKTCYGIGQTIITSTKDINNTLQNIKTTLDEESSYIQIRASSLGSECYQKLQNIANTSKTQTHLLELQIQKNTIKYITDFNKKREDPNICIETPYNNILPSIDKGKQWLASYHEQHQNTIDALKKNDKESIQQLCEQTKNDAQINQQIKDSVQELLQSLEDNQWENKTQQQTTDKIHYKDLLNNQEKKALDDIQKTNQWRIQNTLKIRGRIKYSPEIYIKSLFNEFYGNSGDFIDLHK